MGRVPLVHTLTVILEPSSNVQTLMRTGLKSNDACILIVILLLKFNDEDCSAVFVWHCVVIVGQVTYI